MFPKKLLMCANHHKNDKTNAILSKLGNLTTGVKNPAPLFIW